MADARGWESIDAALARLYGDTEPHGWQNHLGQDALDAVRVYQRTDPVPHWHYVSDGLHASWGFELTLRLARAPADATAPYWAADVLRNLAGYVFRTGNSFAAGHHMNIGGPIAAERPDTDIRGLAFVEDPELGTPFIQVVGLTPDELEAVQLWNTLAFLQTVASRLPLYVTDIDRGSLLRDSAVADQVQAGVEREGSSTGALFVDGASWDVSKRGAVVTLGALPATFVSRLLRARLPFGHDFTVVARGTAIRFHPAGKFSAGRNDGRLDVGVPPDGVGPLADAIRPQAGRTEIDRRLAIEIVPTVLRDASGNPTGEVIG